MALNRILIVCCIFICCQNFAYARIVAVDGVSGFVGSSLINDIQGNNLRVGIHSNIVTIRPDAQIFVGNLYDSAYLKNFLKDVDLYYQMAAIASVEPHHSLQEYILTNSIGAYLASRINKSMTLIAMSTVCINDLDRSADIDLWSEKFIFYISSMNDNIINLSEYDLKSKLENFISLHPLPQLHPRQYYGFSKLLLEKLLYQSGRSRNGNIYLIKPAMIIGDDLSKRRGDSVAKNIMEAIFNKRTNYEIWDRTNYYTPIAKLKAMMLYIPNANVKFAKFEIFDSGAVAINQHDFVKMLLQELNVSSPNLLFVSSTGFNRTVMMQKDTRLNNYYPSMYDVNLAIKDMVRRYKSNGHE